MKYKELISLIAVCLTAIVIVFIAGNRNAPTALGSIINGESYYATTTSADGTSGPTNTTVIKNGPGQLGSIIITGLNNGSFALYDATTSDVTQRAPTLGTTSILVASIPPKTASTTGTNQYDVTLRYGLLFVGSTNLPTTTITWK